MDKTLLPEFAELANIQPFYRDRSPSLTESLPSYHTIMNDDPPPGDPPPGDPPPGNPPPGNPPPVSHVWIEKLLLFILGTAIWIGIVVNYSIRRYRDPSWESCSDLVHGTLLGPGIGCFVWLLDIVQRDLITHAAGRGFAIFCATALLSYTSQAICYRQPSHCGYQD